MHFDFGYLLNSNTSLHLLTCISVAVFPFFLPLLLHLLFQSKDQGTPNEVLWKRERQIPSSEH